jgi:hypothetical protein
MSGACAPSSAPKQVDHLDQDAPDDVAAASTADKQE